MNRNNNRQEPHTTTSMTQAEEMKILDAQVVVMIMVDTTIMEMTTGSLGRQIKYLVGGAITVCTDCRSDRNTFVLFGIVVFDSTMGVIRSSISKKFYPTRIGIPFYDDSLFPRSKVSPRSMIDISSRLVMVFHKKNYTYRNYPTILLCIICKTFVLL